MTSQLIIYDDGPELKVGAGHLGMREAYSASPRTFFANLVAKLRVSIPGAVFPDLSMFVRVGSWSSFNDAYDVAAIKVTEGRSYRDPYAREFLGKFQGFPVCYHFLRRETSVVEQVDNYLTTCWTYLGREAPFGIALDVETSGAGTNPTMTQADQFLSLVQQRTGRNRSTFKSYVPRWWYTTFGGGSSALRDTVWWLSDYSAVPNQGPMAGWDAPDVLQYGSTIPGSGMPAGDMNIAVNRTFTELVSLLTGAAASPEEDDMSQADAEHGFTHRYDAGQETPIEMIERFKGRYTSLVNLVDWWGNAIGARFNAIDAKLAELTGTDVSTAVANLPPKPEVDES
jgi:hypothetical protein